MENYEALMIDLMFGNTPKERYEYAKQMHLKIGELQGRIDFLKAQFEWIDLNLQQGLGIPKSAIEAILDSFKKNPLSENQIKK